MEELDCHLKFEPMLGDSQLFFFFFSFVKPQQVSGWFSKWKLMSNDICYENLVASSHYGENCFNENLERYGKKMSIFN